MTYFITLIFCLLSILVCNCNCNPDSKANPSDENGDETSGSGGISTVQTILLSVGLLTGVVVCSFCTWRWWVRLCRALRGIEDPEPPSATYPFPDINYPNEPILIEPIPGPYTIASFEMQEINVPTIVPVSDDVGGNAHDWFELNTNFNRGNIEYIAEMGKGWFGKVVKAQVRNVNPFHDRIPAVVKSLHEEANNREQMRFLDEARFYRDETHENILRLLGYSIERTPYLLIFEYWPLGTLKDYLVTKCSDLQSYSLLIRMAIDVANGLEWMEHAGFVHGDLAARNCLVANTAGKVVIGDYGLSTERFREEYYWSNKTAIPLRWSAPECLHVTMNTIITSKATLMSNVWSFGVVLWEITQLGKLPYIDLTDDQVIEQVITTRTFILEKPKTACLPESVIDKLFQIMLTCWNTEPTSRPRITEILGALRTP